MLLPYTGGAVVMTASRGPGHPAGPASYRYQLHMSRVAAASGHRAWRSTNPPMCLWLTTSDDIVSQLEDGPCAGACRSMTLGEQLPDVPSRNKDEVRGVPSHTTKCFHI